VVGAPPPIPLDLRGHFAGWGGKVEEGDTEGKRSGNKKGLGCAVLKIPLESRLALHGRENWTLH